MPDYFFKLGSKNIIIFKLKQFFNTRPYLKIKNNRTDVFDEILLSSIVEFQQYKRLKIQNGLFNAETYAQIGIEMTDTEIEIISLHDSVLKNLLYGVGLVGPCAEWETVAAIIPKDSFIGWNDPKYPKTPQNCFSYCEEQLKQAGHSLKSRGWGTTSKINPHIYQLYLTEDIAGMKKGYQAQQFTEGVLYLKKAIKNKTPVLVGVDAHADLRYNKATKKNEVHHENKDHVTDHFVVIVGMGSDANGKYFLFYDNANLAKEKGASDDNKIYCDCNTYSLIGHGATDYAQGGYGQYTVTQIRVSN